MWQWPTYTGSLFVTISGFVFGCVGRLIEQCTAGPWRLTCPITGIVHPKYSPIFEVTRSLTARARAVQVRQYIEGCTQHYHVRKVIAQSKNPECCHVTPFSHLAPLPTAVWRYKHSKHIVSHTLCCAVSQARPERECETT